MTEFRAEILTQSQHAALRRVAPVVDVLGFYLAGGTAIALRLGHRRSEDFDWFSARPAVPPEELGPELAAAGLTVGVDALQRDTLVGRIDGVRMSFFRYPYALLEPLERWADSGAQVASVTDLACMKLLAVAQRGSRKDFVDVFEILRRGGSLKTLLARFQTKFATTGIVSVLRGLVYFDDAETETMPDMLTGATWDEVKAGIERAVRAELG